MQYWPASKDKGEYYGDIEVNILTEEELANFHIRTLGVSRGAEHRKIVQFHYTQWHSHSCPYSNAILEFRRRVRSVVGSIVKAESLSGPTLVHCR